MPRSWDPRDVAHPKRSTWDEYFLMIARAAETRSNCGQRRGGAVIVNDRRIVSTGYVGAPSGHPHCEDCEPDVCVAVDAEANALLFCGPTERRGATLYTTTAPSFAVARLVANSGVAELVTDATPTEPFLRTKDLLLRSNVRVRALKRAGVLDLTTV